jgi:ATP-dependent RNA helicase DDX54/DBP10
MDAQFADMHRNPDVVVATPGRFLHVVVEMGFQLSTVEYVVFDEADRYDSVILLSFAAILHLSSRR